jgi:hypothetical protein
MIGAKSQDAAKIKSLVAEAGYVIAGQMFGQTGRALSDTDYAAAIRTLGESQSPEQFMGVLRSLGERAYQTYTAKMESATGRGDVDMNVRRMSASQLEALGTSPVVPERLQNAIETEVTRRLAEEVVQERRRTGGPNPTAAEQPRPDLEPAIEREGRRQRRSDTRQQPTIEQEEASIRERAAAAVAEEERQTQRREGREDAADARAVAAQELNEAIFAYRQSRDAKEDAEKQGAKFQAAIAAFARTIASTEAASVRVGGGSGGGAAQDPSAFQLPRRSSRRAPPVPSAPLTGFKYAR